MINTITINWKLLGAELANMDCVEQAQFFDGFAQELNHFDTHMHKEMQLLKVCEIIPEKSKKVLENYLPCLWYKE